MLLNTILARSLTINILRQFFFLNVEVTDVITKQEGQMSKLSQLFNLNGVMVKKKKKKKKF